MQCRNQAGTGTAACTVGVALGDNDAPVAARSSVGSVCQLYRLRDNDPLIPQTHLRVAAPRVANDLEATPLIALGLSSRRLRRAAFDDLLGTLDSHEQPEQDNAEGKRTPKEWLHR